MGCAPTPAYNIVGASGSKTSARVDDRVTHRPVHWDPLGGIRAAYGARGPRVSLPRAHRTTLRHVSTISWKLAAVEGASAAARVTPPPRPPSSRPPPHLRWHRRRDRRQRQEQDDRRRDR